MGRILTALSFLALLAGSSLAHAGLMTFTHEGAGAGSLDGQSFASTDFVITATADTDNWVSCGADCAYLVHVASSIDILGVGTFDFVTATRTFVNGAVVGFSRVSGADLFNGPDAAALDTWDQLTSIGPIGGTGSLLQWTLSDVVTSGGVLVFDSGQGRAVFTATAAGAVPVPASIVLIGLGLVGMGYEGRRKAAKRR